MANVACDYCCGLMLENLVLRDKDKKWSSKLPVRPAVNNSPPSVVALASRGSLPAFPSQSTVMSFPLTNNN